MKSVLVAAVLVLAVGLRLGLRRWRRARDPTATGGRLPWPSGPASLVAGREVRERLRARSFRVVTVVVLVVVAAAILIPVLTRSPAQPVRVGLTGAVSGPDRAALATAARAAGTGTRLVNEPSTAAARTALAAGRLDVVLSGEALVVKTAPSSSDTSPVARFVRSLSESLGIDRAVRAAGLTAAQVRALQDAAPASIESLKPSKSKAGAAQPTSVIGVILVFVMLSQYCTWTLIGVMEEKASRVVEVLLAAVRPIRLLTGKVLGIGLVAMGQAVLVAGFAAALAAAVGSDLLSGTTPLVLVASLLWLLLGYAFYCWVYAATGSMIERQDQIQAIALPLSIPMLVGYIAALTAAGSGSASPLVRVLAYVPFTSPFAMPVLVGLKAVTWWEFCLSVAASVAATVVVARLAATIYRRAVLRTGRRVRLREVLAG